MKTEAGGNLVRNIGGHLFDRRHPQDAHTRSVDLGGDENTLKNIVCLIGGYDNVDDFLLGIDCQAENAEALLAYARPLGVKDGRSLSAGILGYLNDLSALPRWTIAVINTASVRTIISLWLINFPLRCCKPVRGCASRSRDRRQAR